MATTSAPRPRKSATVTAAARTVRKHREKMRSQGMRLVQLWTPDTRQPAFQAQVRRQSLLASRKDRSGNILAELDSVADEVAGWSA
jgi:hypothetical protein